MSTTSYENIVPVTEPRAVALEAVVTITASLLVPNAVFSIATTILEPSEGPEVYTLMGFVVLKSTILRAVLIPVVSIMTALSPLFMEFPKLEIALVAMPWASTFFWSKAATSDALKNLLLRTFYSLIPPMMLLTTPKRFFASTKLSGLLLKFKIVIAVLIVAAFDNDEEAVTYLSVFNEVDKLVAGKALPVLSFVAMFSLIVTNFYEVAVSKLHKSPKNPL